MKYASVNLHKEDTYRLLTKTSFDIPDGWTVCGTHMTIDRGVGLGDKLITSLGREVTLTAHEIGTNDTAIAVKVIGFPSSNPVPHITLAYDQRYGGKQEDSNNIVNWRKLPELIEVSGVVSERGLK